MLCVLTNVNILKHRHVALLDADIGQYGTCPSQQTAHVYTP